jgi:phosphoribosyl 1,2-cyclic phosphodiesterase
LQIDFCGVRGSTPAPGIDFIRYGGHTSCLALTRDGDARPGLVLDAGAGLLQLARRFGETPFSGTILLTHLHWDHVLGLPFFAPADRTDADVEVLLPEQASGEDAASVLAGMMAPPYFPIGPTQLRGRWTFGTVAPGEQQIAGFTVLAREIPHKGGRTFGYRVSDGHSTLAYMPDHCPTMFGAGESGFGECHPAAVELAAGADVLVHDAQLLPSELAAEADFGHSVADYALELARRADARSVVFFHHRHTRTDDALDQLASRFTDASPPVSIATEGTILDL